MPRFQKGGASFQNNKKGGFYQPPYNHQTFHQNSRDVDQFRYMEDSGKYKSNANQGYQSASGGNNRQYEEDGTSDYDNFQDERHQARIQQYPVQQYKTPESNQYGGGGGTRYYEKNATSGSASVQNSKSSRYNQSVHQSQSNQTKSINNNQQYYVPTSNANHSTSQGESRQYHRREPQDVFPYWQPLLKCENAPGEMSAIQRELFSQAEKGELLIEIQNFIIILLESQEKALKNIQENECYELIDLAEEQGIVHRTKRNFANMKTLCFVSLQLDVISSECLQWVLRSLRRDEMSPTERAIQSRIKEAFAFKISQQQWDFIIDCIKQQELYEAQKTEISDYPERGGIGTLNNKTKGISGLTTVIDSKNAIASSSVQQSKKSRRGQTVQIQQAEEPAMFKFSDIIEDSAIGSISRAIFLINEPEWLGVDQNNINSSQDPAFQNDLDVLHHELIDFLEEYFCKNVEDVAQQNQKEEEKWCSSIENGLTKTVNQNFRGFSQSQGSTPQLVGTYEIDFEEVRAIPGGRYGCAQFVKICGPPKLRQCSLGRLAQLVQQAVKEDILRYHKTLLVWTTTVDKHKKKAAAGVEDAILNQNNEAPKKQSPTSSKLFIVKQALIEILTENKQGMSLAQLPLYLRRKLQFSLDLNELGFPKLKDLILSMHDKIKLELRGHNHPFAYLIKNNSSTTEQESSPDQFQTSVSQITQKQTSDSDIIEWFIEQIDLQMRDSHEGLNQEQILGILREQDASAFLGFQTLLDLIQKRVLSSKLAKDRKWILTVHSETKFILNAQQIVINQNVSTSLITNSKENLNFSSSTSSFKKESVGHQHKQSISKPTSKEENEFIKVELLSDRANQDEKSQASNDSIASSVNLSQDFTRGGHSQPKTPSSIGNTNPFTPTNFTDQSQIRVSMANVMNILSPKSFQNTSSELIKQTQLGSIQAQDNLYQMTGTIQTMNSQPILEHSRHYNSNFQNNAYQKQNVSIQNQHLSQFQQTDGASYSNQPFNNHIIWQHQMDQSSHQNFQNQQQINYQLQQQQHQLRNAPYQPQYQPYQVYQQPQVQNSQMKHNLLSQQMQHQNSNLTGRGICIQEQVMMMNNQMPQQFEISPQHQTSAVRYENSQPHYSNSQMIQASFENLNLNRFNNQQQQPYINSNQYQTQQQVQQQQNQQLFKSQLPIFKQQISQKSSGGSNNGLTSVNHQTNNHYFQEQPARNNFSDAQYMSNENQQTTSIFQISPNQKMKQIMYEHPSLYNMYRNTSNIQHEKDSGFHQTPFQPFENDGKFTQFQQPQRVLVQHIHGDQDQNFKIKTMQQYQMDQMQQQQQVQKLQKQYQQQNIFSPHPNTNEQKYSTQQYNQYYHTFDAQEDEQQYPNRPSFGTPTDIQEQQYSIQMIEKLLQQDEDLIAATAGGSHSQAQIVVRDFSDPDFSNNQPFRGSESGWKDSMSQQQNFIEEIGVKNNIFKPLPPSTKTPQPNQRPGILMQSIYEQPK